MLNSATFKRWRCRHLRARLVDFAGGELGPRERKAVEAHLAACPRCAAEVHALREVPTRLLGAAAPLSQDEHYWEQQRRDIMRGVRAAVPEKPGWQPPRLAPQWQAGLAAAAALLIAVTSYRLLLVPSVPPQVAKDEQALDAATALALADWSDTLLAAAESGADSEWITDAVVGDWTPPEWPGIWPAAVIPAATRSSAVPRNYGTRKCRT